MAKLETYEKSSYVGRQVARLAGLTVYNVLTYDAPTDGTSDCTSAVQSAITAALAAGGGTVYFPAGTYTFALASAALNPGAGNIRFIGDGMDRTILYWDGGTDTVFDTFKCLFRNTAAATGKGPIEFEDLQIKGAFPTRINVGGAGIVLDNYPFVGLRRVKFKDIPCFAVQCESIEEVSVEECTWDTVVRDQCRFRSSRNVRIVNNYFKNSSDDSIALHQANYITGAGNIRERITIVGNVFEDTTGISCFGARAITITGNVFHRCKYGAIRLDGSTAEPHQFGCVITGNYCYDTLDGDDFSQAAGGVISINNNPSKASTAAPTIIPGNMTTATGTFVTPYAYRENQYGADNAVPPGYGFIIADNVIMRTLPPVSAYSDWGFGQAMFATGWVDTAVAESGLRPITGITICSNAVGFQVTDNVVMNCRRFLTVEGMPSNTNFFGRISGNQVFDCWEYGIYHANTTSASQHCNVQITDNHFNLDPYLVATGRNADGSWNSGTATTRLIQTGSMTARGYVIMNNVIQNCFRIVGGSVTYSYIRNNVVKAEVAALGTSGSNKGVGDVYSASDQYEYLQVISTPTDANYDLPTLGPGPEFSAQPSAGFWVRGTFVRNIDPASTAVLGWVRLTTGNGHVAGTDWKKVDIT